MIFVIADDNMLHVLNSETESQGEFEGIDVEEGIYRFFDETGAPLAAEFEKPNKKGKLFGIFSWVVSGKYRLISAESTGSLGYPQSCPPLLGLRKIRTSPVSQKCESF
jgi:hypothetical protein